MLCLTRTSSVRAFRKQDWWRTMMTRVDWWMQFWVLLRYVLVVARQQGVKEWRSSSGHSLTRTRGGRRGGVRCSQFVVLRSRCCVIERARLDRRADVIEGNLEFRSCFVRINLYVEVSQIRFMVYILLYQCYAMLLLVCYEYALYYERELCSYGT